VGGDDLWRKRKLIRGTGQKSASTSTRRGTVKKNVERSLVVNLGENPRGDGKDNQTSRKNKFKKSLSLPQTIKGHQLTKFSKEGKIGEEGKPRST